MRISDWSSDVCSSDLRPRVQQLRGDHGMRADPRRRLPVDLARMDHLQSERLVAERRGPQQDHALPYHQRPAGGAERSPEERLPDRSEEHTSELQSLMRNPYAVFCMKKKIINQKT